MISLAMEWLESEIISQLSLRLIIECSMIIMGNYYRLMAGIGAMVDCLSLTGFIIWV